MWTYCIISSIIIVVCQLGLVVSPDNLIGCRLVNLLLVNLKLLRISALGNGIGGTLNHLVVLLVTGPLAIGSILFSLLLDNKLVILRMEYLLSILVVVLAVVETP